MVVDGLESYFDKMVSPQATCALPEIGMCPGESWGGTLTNVWK
jgi:hypothetical protein